MMLIPCYIAKSAIEGLGVFAATDIARGTAVWRFDEDFDILVPKERIGTAPAHVREFFEHYAYEIGDHPDHMALDGDDGRFMNHSETPNLDFSTPGLGVALRDIARGEELTCDYRLLASGEFEMSPSRNAP